MRYKDLGDNHMTQNNTIDKSLAVKSENFSAENTQNNSSNVVSITFPATLKALRETVDPQLVKQRDGWRDRNGNTHQVDYVEWHTVADILDEKAPNWTHTIREIREIGENVAVIVAVTIDGITREGLGTGSAHNEIGIKKAEHDALKRAAVKFGIARELYKKEYERAELTAHTEREETVHAPENPIAQTLGDMISGRQLGLIRALAREAGVNSDDECRALMNCKTDELSKRAASFLITHLQSLPQRKEAAVAAA
jgi:recombination DNA repair RAD52 pathway protein